MIEVVLHNGVVLSNNPEDGWNLDSPKEIMNCLEETGKYRLTNQLGNHYLRKEEVKEVRYKK